MVNETVTGIDEQSFDSCGDRVHLKFRFFVHEKMYKSACKSTQLFGKIKAVGFLDLYVYILDCFK